MGIGAGHRVITVCFRHSFLVEILSKSDQTPLLLEGGALDPVVQNIISLTSLLRGHLIKCFTTL